MTTETTDTPWSAGALVELVMVLTDEVRELTVERLMDAYAHYEVSKADDGLDPPSDYELDGIFATVEHLMRERARRAGRRLSRRWLKVMRLGLAQAKASAADASRLAEGIGRMLDEERDRKIALYEAEAASAALN